MTESPTPPATNGGRSEIGSDDVDLAVGRWTSHGAGPPDDELPSRARRPRDDGWDHAEAITTTPWDTPPTHLQDAMDPDVVLDAGWGQLVFGQTFADQRMMASVLRQEIHGRRDICLYLRDPHVFVARHPHEFFIDPSYTYRLRFTPEDPPPPVAPGVVVRPIQDTDDAEAMDRIYVRCGMRSSMRRPASCA